MSHTLYCAESAQVEGEQISGASDESPTVGLSAAQEGTNYGDILPQSSGHGYRQGHNQPMIWCMGK